jgi:hypothetical protein
LNSEIDQLRTLIRDKDHQILNHLSQGDQLKKTLNVREGQLEELTNKNEYFI